MTPEVKICGLTKTQEAVMLNKYKANYAGIVLFYEKSKRYATVEQAWQVLRCLSPAVNKVAVVVSPTVDQINVIQAMDFSVIQIHGALSEEVLSICKLPIWRAYNISGEQQEAVFKSERIAGYVLDGKNPGAGKTFDWKELQGFQRNGNKLILAGGLHAGNVQEGIKLLKPDVVDVSSGVEGGDGKDAAKIEDFIRKVRMNG